MEKDIRWQQRFNNFKKAYDQLAGFIQRSDLNKLEEQGLIQCFEYTYELGWNLLKDYLEAEGYQEVTGSRSAISLAFKTGLISDGEGWMQMFKDRNKTSHTYNEETAREIVKHIYQISFPMFTQLKDKFETLL